MWKQVKDFNIKKMGTKKGYCLQNVRLGFGIPAKYASAKIDMEANKKAGTLHNIDTIPINVTVPVYIDSASKYEHIIVCDKGTYYSDGRKLKSTKGLKFFGWGELCEDVRVVERVKDKYKIGKYKVTAKLLNVRDGAGTKYKAKTYKELTANAREQNKKLGNEKANGYLKGVVCSVSKIVNNWGYTPSGWICLDYCKKV